MYLGKLQFLAIACEEALDLNEFSFRNTHNYTRWASDRQHSHSSQNVLYDDENWGRMLVKCDVTLYKPKLINSTSAESKDENDLNETSLKYQNNCI